MHARFSADYDPTDLIGQEQRQEEESRRQFANWVAERADLCELLADHRFRRRMRRQLFAAGLDVHGDGVSSEGYADHGFMRAREAMRTEALRMFWPIVRMVASGELSSEVFRRLMTEVDDR